MSDINKAEKFVVRGGKTASHDELIGHLGLGLRLENTGVLLGSGASVGSGGKTMGALWKKYCEEKSESVEWLVTNNFLTSAQAQPNAEVDVEKLLGAIMLANVDAVRRGEDRTELVAREHELRSAVIDAAALDEGLWSSRSDPNASEKLEAHLRLLSRFQGSRQPGQSAPWVFTTNYDLAVEWAAEALGIHVVNGFSGLHDRHFQPNGFDLSLQNSRATGEARFGAYNINLVKLHGSLSWQLSDGYEKVMEVSSDTVAERISSLRKGENVDEKLMLIHPTAAKYVDTVGFVYGELIRRMTEFLAKPNTTLLISGYGFGDSHINRLILSGLQNPTLQLIVYHPSWQKAENEVGNSFLQRLKDLELPRVVIVGGGSEAYFDGMTKDLPEPTMIDDVSPETKKLLEQIAKNLSSDKKQNDEFA